MPTQVLKFMDYAHSLGALYTMKADDDTFVFVDRILMELQHLPQSCLYWGSAAQLPDMDGYANSVIGMPLSKWYIEQSHFRYAMDPAPVPSLDTECSSIMKLVQCHRGRTIHGRWRIHTQQRPCVEGVVWLTWLHRCQPLHAWWHAILTLV